MTNDQVIALLCEFFMDEFCEDAAGVGDWIVQSGNDVDEIYDAVTRMKESINGRAS